MNHSALDRLMAPVAHCLDRASLAALVDLRASPQATERMSVLAARANEGGLSAAERAEYETCVMFANFLGMLQSQARQKLSAAP